MNAAKLVIAGEEMDLKRGLSFGLNYSVDDVRKIEKKNSNYSKTLTLVGSPVVNKLMGGLFDVNADFTFFNPNSRTDAKIVVNSSTVIDGTLQLKSIDIIDRDNTNNTTIEYKCSIVSKSVDFMAVIKGKMLDELDLSTHNHLYTDPNIRATWDGSKDYVYPLFWNNLNNNGGSNNYFIEDFLPSIFYKTYLLKIAEEAGYTLGGSLMDETTEEGLTFSKEIIPYSGIVPVLPAAEYTRRKFKASPLAYTQFSTGSFTSVQQGGQNNQTSFDGGLLKIFNDTGGSNFDNSGVWDNVTNTYKVDAKGSYSINMQVDVRMNFNSNGIEAFQNGFKRPTGSTAITQWNPNTKEKPYRITFRLTKNGVVMQGLGSDVIYMSSATGSDSSFNAANSYTVESDKIITLSASRLNLSVGDVIAITYSIEVLSSTEFSVYTPTYEATRTNLTGLVTVPIDWTCTAKTNTSFIYNTCTPLVLAVNDEVSLNSYIPAKLKQDDLFKDLLKRKGCYFSTDIDDPYKIILDTRDSYYSKGETLDWSHLRDTTKKDSIKFLSELQNEEVLFTYKQGNDFYSTSYEEAADQIYGEKRIAFQNDFARGEKKIESLFSSSPLISNATTTGAAIVSAWNVDPSKNKGFTVMYYHGVIPTVSGRTWNMYFDVVGSGNFSPHVIYPYAGHLDNPLTPSYDLNFGETAYPNYIGKLNSTNATLYNRYLRNYMSQINKGRLVTTYFKLDEVVIDKIRKGLNARIWAGDSYYLINKIVDYDPINDKLTKVELLKMPDGVPFLGRTGSFDDADDENPDNPDS